MIKKEIKDESGFTLLEILIAVALFSFVIAGVIEVFSSSNKSYMTQEDVVALQQNVRVAKMFIERDIRMTGFKLGDNFNYLGEPVSPLEFTNGGETGPDKLVIRYLSSAGCIDDPAAEFASCSELPELQLGEKMPDTSTEADVQNYDMTPNDDEDDETAVDIWDAGCSCGSDSYAGTPFQNFLAIITSPNGSTSDVFVVTGVQAKKLDSVSKIANGPNVDYEGETYENKLVNSYPENSTINFFNPDSLASISYELVDGILIRDGERIAENIEDLQFAFCGDFNDDGVVDFEPNPDDPENDDWYYDQYEITEDQDLTEEDKAKVKFIRISILGRTNKQHDIASKRTPLEDHAGAETSDKFHRRLLQTTVQLRNLAL